MHNFIKRFRINAGCCRRVHFYDSAQTVEQLLLVILGLGLAGKYLAPPTGGFTP